MEGACQYVGVRQYPLHWWGKYTGKDCNRFLLMAYYCYSYGDRE